MGWNWNKGWAQCIIHNKHNYNSATYRRWCYGNIIRLKIIQFGRLSNPGNIHCFTFHWVSPRRFQVLSRMFIASLLFTHGFLFITPIDHFSFLIMIFHFVSYVKILKCWTVWKCILLLVGCLRKVAVYPHQDSTKPTFLTTTHFRC